MTSSLDQDLKMFPLPQHGFGADIDFKSLSRQNHFLYRVYTPKERSPFVDDTDPFFIAPKFDEVYARSPVEISTSSIINPLDGTYADVARHMDWTTRASSTYVSTSFSFSWSIWEALRRYHQGVKKDVEIAVIDAQAVADRAATAVQLLRKSSTTERKQQHGKWTRFSQESQSVLVHGFIPGTAILASIPLLSVLQKMPSYFLQTKKQIITGNPLDHVAWNYMEKQPSYRQFCENMSDRFFAQPQEIRFRDVTGGSMRLALTLLRPWFHQTVMVDFDVAVTTLQTLAITIAHWPGQWWAKDHSELNSIIGSMALALGEELQEKHSHHDQEELTRLQNAVETLEKIIATYETPSVQTVVKHDRVCAGISKEIQSPIALVTPEGSPRLRPRRNVSMTVTVPPRGVVSFQTPITPPESPRNSWSLSSNAQYRYVPPVIAFQPLSPPEFLFDQPRSRATSLLSSPVAPTSRPATPPSRQPSPTISLPASPTSQPAALDDAVPEDAEVDEASSSESEGHTLSFIPIIPVIPAYTSSLGMAETPQVISDLSSGLKINIPRFSVPSFLPPSPTDSTRSRQSAMSSPQTLAPSSPQFMAKYDDSLGSPLRTPPISSTTDSSWEKLPPPPASPAMSWGSISSTLPSRVPSPTLVNDLSFTTESSSSSVIPKTSSSSLSSIHLSSSIRSSRSISSFEQLQLTSSVHNSPLREPLPSPHLSPIRSRSSISSLERLQPTGSPHSSPTRKALPSPIEAPPQVEVPLYLPPRAAIGLLVPSVDADAESDEDSARPATALVETASFIVTGFLVGAFITLFFISTQRRTLLYLT